LEFELKKAIVTGANGFLGSALIKELIKNGIEVIALCRKDHNRNIPTGVQIVPFDFEHSNDLPLLIKDRNIDTFYHFAWEGSSGAARADTKLQLNNVNWTVDCLKAAKEIGCTRFVCAGTIMEHETMEAAYKQENRPGLGYIYGSGKLAAHTMCMPVAANIGIDLMWAKITNAYGPGELSPRFINTTLRKILNNEPLQFTSGIQNYDFVYIDDVARAFYLIGKNGKPFCHYLIGSSHAQQLKLFIMEIKKILAPSKDFILGDVPYTGVQMSLSDFDCSQTEKDIGFKAEINFAEGILKTMNWIKEYDKK
jgi:UDP-glucose 4-epimerase